MSAENRPAIKDKDRPNMSSFSWQDPFLLDDQLEEDERMIGESARAFSQDRLTSRATRP